MSSSVTPSKINVKKRSKSSKDKNKTKTPRLGRTSILARLRQRIKQRQLKQAVENEEVLVDDSAMQTEENKEHHQESISEGLDDANNTASALDVEPNELVDNADAGDELLSPEGSEQPEEVLPEDDIDPFSLTNDDLVDNMGNGSEEDEDIDRVQAKRPRLSCFLSQDEQKDLLKYQPSTAVAKTGTEVIKFTTLLKIAKELPKWNRKSVSYDFLRLIKTKLSNSEWPQQQWIRFLPLVFSDADSDKSEWVSKNIVQKATTWNQACYLFNEHFQERDHRVQWEEQYDRLKQLDKETVQSFSDRFKRVCTQLGIADDNDRAIEHFQRRLLPSFAGEFYNHINQLKATTKIFGGDAAISLKKQLSSLDGVIRLAIQLDVTRRTTQAQSASVHSNSHNGTDRSTSSSHGQPSSNTRTGFGNNKKRSFADIRKKNGSTGSFTGNKKSGDQHCRYHPNSNDHSTENCRFGEFLKKQGQSSNGASTTKTESSVPTCFKCNEKGHLANDPKCRLFGQRKDSGGSTTANGTSKKQTGARIASLNSGQPQPPGKPMSRNDLAYGGKQRKPSSKNSSRIAALSNDHRNDSSDSDDSESL